MRNVKRSRLSLRKLFGDSGFPRFRLGGFPVVPATMRGWMVGDRLWQIHHHPHPRHAGPRCNEPGLLLREFASRQGSEGKRGETHPTVPVGHAPSYPWFVIGKPCNALQKKLISMLFSVKLDPPERPSGLEVIAPQNNAFFFSPKEHGNCCQPCPGVVPWNAMVRVLRRPVESS